VDTVGDGSSKGDEADSHRLENESVMTRRTPNIPLIHPKIPLSIRTNDDDNDNDR